MCRLYCFHCWLVVLFIAFTCSVAQLTDEEILSAIDDFVDDVTECASIPGLTLSVVKEGRDFVAKGYGVRDLTVRLPVTNETLFLLASVTKAMTGIVLHLR